MRDHFSTGFSSGGLATNGSFNACITLLITLSGYPYKERRAFLLIANLDDLEEKLTGIVVILLAVTFLANVVTWNGNLNILALGVAIGLVLFALGYLLNGRSKIHCAEKPDETDTE